MHRQVNVLFVAAISVLFLVLWLDNNAGVEGQTTDYPLGSCICLDNARVYATDCTDTAIIESKCYAYSGYNRVCSASNYYGVHMNGSVKLIENPDTSLTSYWASTENCINCSAMCPNDALETLLHIEGDCYHYCECRNGTGYIRHCPPYVVPGVWICKDPNTVSLDRLAFCYNTSTTYPYMYSTAAP